MRTKAIVLLAVLSYLLVPCAHGDVSLPSILSDHMVLQRGATVPVWGTADPEESVTVTLGAQKATATAGPDGRWKVRLQPVKGPGPVELTVAGKNAITIRDVLIGTVWVCSGQSNMQWAVGQAKNAAAEIAQADYPRIRLFTVPRRVAAYEPQTDCQGSWVLCSPKTVGGFSAVGYFFGRDVHKKTDVPVGLIHTSWGGTPAEAWTSHETLAAYPALKPILTRWAERATNFPVAKAEYEKRLKQWTQQAEKAKAEKKKAPAKPRAPSSPDQHPHWPAGLYNGMIAPLIPFAIKGAIWYQGESNAGRAYQYRTLFPAMIRDWRQAWGQGDFTFLFVQLANFRAVEPEPGESDWAELREAQTMTLALPRTGMAVAIDIGEAGDIHPKNKQEVGRRLALAAHAIAYGHDIPYSGPMYHYMAVEGKQIRIYFTHTDGGLMCTGGELKGFAIAGRDRKFVWAQAKIEGDTVVVSNDTIQEPVAVRYAWAINPICNLYNKANLPASPFRTDSWPGVTAQRE